MILLHNQQQQQQHQHRTAKYVLFILSLSSMFHHYSMLTKDDTRETGEMYL